MIGTINKILWSIAIIMIFTSGIYYSIKLKFPQLNIKQMIKSLKEKDKTSAISPKDTLLMSLGSKLGAGSLAGIAFAIYYGGIGTIFWMWITAIIASLNCFLENSLSIIYKEKDGEFYKGGPAYYLKKGLNLQILAKIFAIIAIFTYIIGFLGIQNNTITKLTYEIYQTNKYITSTIVTLISALVIIKGVKGISSFCNKIVPLMALLYVIVGNIIIFSNITKLPIILLNIIKEAFKIKAITGGIIYRILIGIQKGIFSSEAGVGTSAISSGATESTNYKKQGYIGVLETFFINIFITTLTALIIILSNYQTLTFDSLNGIEITKYAFSYHLGHFGEIILLLILILFSFSTIIAGYYFGESNLKFLTQKTQKIKILQIITIISIFLGGILSSLTVWKIVDLLVAILTIINTYAIIKSKNIIMKKHKK